MNLFCLLKDKLSKQTDLKEDNSYEVQKQTERR
jgi:hypothetical protein